MGYAKTVRKRRAMCRRRKWHGLRGSKVCLRTTLLLAMRALGFWGCWPREVGVARARVAKESKAKRAILRENMVGQYV
jgi:hypothetical protein